jgi:hypothetical protein
MRSSSSCCLRTMRTVHAPLAVGPCAPSGRSARRLSASSSSCSSRVLACLSFDPFFGEFLLHEVRGQSVLECRTVRDGADDPRVHRRRFVIEGAVLEV